MEIVIPFESEEITSKTGMLRTLAVGKGFWDHLMKRPLDSLEIGFGLHCCHLVCRRLWNVIAVSLGMVAFT